VQRIFIPKRIKVKKKTVGLNVLQTKDSEVNPCALIKSNPFYWQPTDRPVSLQPIPVIVKLPAAYVLFITRSSGVVEA
jgi:hypothetical protein